MVHFFTGAVEDFVEHLELGVANVFRGEFGPLSSIVNLSVRDSGVKGGLDSHHSSQESNIESVNSVDLRCGQGQGLLQFPLLLLVTVTFESD